MSTNNSNNNNHHSYGSVPRVQNIGVEVVMDGEQQSLLSSSSQKNQNDPFNSFVSWKLVGLISAILLIVMSVVLHTGQPREDDTGTRLLDINMAEPLYYMDQLVDHSIGATESPRFSQRYYEKNTYFGGPGHPIFIIVGGEDELEGLLYPFIHEHLAKDFRAITYAVEHRFFGQSKPMNHPTNTQLKLYLTPKQALNDLVRFIQHKRNELGCSLFQKDSNYCPVITVGGSYPGFLSALMRFAHADVVDISYASSAPLNLYSHHVNVYAYYEKISAEAERASPGCYASVRRILYQVHDNLLQLDPEPMSRDALALEYGLCPHSIPSYIQTHRTLAQELIFVVATHFAEFNMMYYPPVPSQELIQACEIFQKDDRDSRHGHGHNHRHRNAVGQTIAKFLALSNNSGKARPTCYDLQGMELPDGPNATISASDWSGVGSGDASIYWEFLSCQLLAPTGFSTSSMFPARPWTFEWEAEHCWNRFEMIIEPNGLEDEFHFDERDNVTRLLLTNGLVDGWSVASILEKDAEGIEVVNMIHGAHHSDLDHHGPTPLDTEDVTKAFVEIHSILGRWLDEIKGKN